MNRTLETEPLDALEDSGPRHRRGCLSTIIIAFLALSVIGNIGEAFEKPAGERTYHAVLAFLLATLALLVLYVQIRGRRIRKSALTGIDVLREVLRFDIEMNTTDVATTAFFRPGEVYPGFNTTLVIALQNYASRQRVVELRFPFHEFLGELNSQTLCLKLAPGQAAVYRHPIAISRVTLPGTYTVAVKFRVRAPKGYGSRLIRKAKGEQQLVLTRSRRTLAVLEVVLPPQYAESTMATVAEPQYVSIYSPTQAEPRFKVLEQLTRARPDESIRMDE